MDDRRSYRVKGKGYMMEEHEWKKLWQIIKELEDEIGDFEKTFSVSGSFKHDGDYSFYTDDVYRILCEEIEPFDEVKNTKLAKRMLKEIGVNV